MVKKKRSNDIFEPLSPKLLAHRKQIDKAQLLDPESYVDLKDSVEEKKIRRIIEQQYAQ